MPSIQYPISLPPEFDMSAIETRVRERAHAFESLPGLRLKAFLMSSTAQGDARNMYAPFYVWDDERSLLEFLTGSLFGAVIDSFGRPAVHQWQVLEFDVGDRGVEPKIATIETIAAGAGRRPPDIRGDEAVAHRAALDTPGLFASCALLDPRSWSVTRVRFWANPAAVRSVAAGAQRYRVLRALGSAVGR